MQTIVFDQEYIDWENNSGVIITWLNNSTTPIAWLSNAASNNIRYASFVRINTGTTIYRFATTPTALTIPAVDSQPFQGLGQLVKIGDAQRDIKSTANETTFTLVGIDTALLGWVLGQNVKGASIQAWHGFFNHNNELITSGGQGGLYQFFNGFIHSFSISEQWMEELRMYVGLITVSASSTQQILANRVAGRYTNNNAWQFFNPTDTSMNRVAFISTITYQFGLKA